MQLPTGIIEKLLLSILVGGAIGVEREYRSKSAGFRTLTLICLGSALFTIFSELIGVGNNPDRIASNIATGIGFVGAGVIFKGDFGVNGITTAAMIWVTAALGMGIGADRDQAFFAALFDGPNESCGQLRRTLKADIAAIRSAQKKADDDFIAEQGWSQFADGRCLAHALPMQRRFPAPASSIQVQCHW